MDIDRRTLLAVIGASGMYGGIGTTTGRETSHAASGPTALPPEIEVQTEDGETRRVIPGVTPVDEQLRGAQESVATSNSLGPEEVDPDQDVQVAVVVSVVGQNAQDVLPPEETLRIVVGAYEDTDPVPTSVPGEELAVSVTRPDSSVEEFTVTTDEQGNGTLSYELGGEGTYTVAVEGESASTSTDVTVGSVVEIASQSGVFEDYRLVGQETTVRAVAREGTRPLSAEDLTLRVTRGGETVTETETTTDSDGFASISFTPDQPGTYGVAVDRGGERVDSEELSAVDAVIGVPRRVDNALAGDQSLFGGYLRDAAGPIANEPLTIEFSLAGTTYHEETLQTDDGGIFSFQYELPADIQDETGRRNLQISAERADGQSVPLKKDSLAVDSVETADDTDQVSFVSRVERSEFTGLFGQPLYAPGESVPVELSATDDGDPIAGETIELYVDYGRDGPPAYTDSVTTDDEGTAMVEIPTSEDGPVNLGVGGEAVLSYDGTEYSTNFGAIIEAVLVSRPIPLLTPGEQTVFTLEATDIRTGDPTEGVHQLLDFQYETAFNGSFDSTSGVTGSDGTDSVPVQTPSDVQFGPQANIIDKSFSGTLHVSLPTDMPGTLSMPDAVSAGETVDISFETPDDTTATGFVFAQSFAPTHSFGSAISSGETVSVQVPETANVVDLFDITRNLTFEVVTIDGNGQLYGDRKAVALGDPEGPPPVIGDAPPQDLNGDGTYEDINGDGSHSITDVQLFFEEIYQNRDSEYVRENLSFFDFTGDGQITLDDVRIAYSQYVDGTGE